MKLAATVTALIGAVSAASDPYAYDSKEKFDMAMADAFKAFADNYAEGFPGFLDEVHEEIMEAAEQNVEDTAEFLDDVQEGIEDLIDEATARADAVVNLATDYYNEDYYLEDPSYNYDYMIDEPMYIDDSWEAYEAEYYDESGDYDYDYSDPWREVKDVIGTLNYIGKDPSGFMDSVKEEIISQMKRDVENLDMQLDDGKCKILMNLGYDIMCTEDYYPYVLAEKEDAYKPIDDLKQRVLEAEGKALNLQECSD